MRAERMRGFAQPMATVGASGKPKRNWLGWTARLNRAQLPPWELPHEIAAICTTSGPQGPHIRMELSSGYRHRQGSRERSEFLHRRRGRRSRYDLPAGFQFELLDASE